MKISWNWLSEYVGLAGLTPEAVAERLTYSGLELEGLERVGDELAPIVVGHIDSIIPHPNADKLVLCQVRFEGSEAAPAQIVCGASNMSAGDRVPVVPAGSRLPDGRKIKKGKVRGEISNGMMCSRSELGLGDDHDGLMILPKDAEIGQSLADVLALRDVVLEFAITPNRGDCLSHIGVAREVAALFGRERMLPPTLSGAIGISGDAGPVSDAVDVIIEDVEGCPRYSAAVVKNITVGQSPGWLRNRLLAIGQRPVNNLVDVTNYVMFETGHPLHAFDYDALARGRKRAVIVVRAGRDGETMESIDHVVRSLCPTDVVITDGERAVAVGGVMGGVDTEVSETTTNVLLECAAFDPRRIRRTGKRLGLNSESSYRFERFVDPQGVTKVLARTVELILQTIAELDSTAAADGPVAASGVVDVYPRVLERRSLILRVARCNSILGTEISASTMADLLGSIDLEVITTTDTELTVKIPTFRPDLEREIDLIEEVGRLFGFDRVVATAPRGDMGFIHTERAAPNVAQPIVTSVRLDQVERVRDRMADSGLLEAVNYAFVSPVSIANMRYGVDDPRSTPIEVANPLSEDWSVMRSSLLPALVLNVRHNLAHREASVALFELGPTFVNDADNPETGVRQTLMLAGVMAGIRPGPVGDKEPYDVYDLKAALEAVCQDLGVDLSTLNHNGSVSTLHPGVGATLHDRGEVVGHLGQLHPTIADRFELKVPIYVFEIVLGPLFEGIPSAQFREIPRYPAATRDIALIVDADTPFGAFETAIKSFKNRMLERITLSSVYRGDPIPAGKKSVALAAVYRSAKGSLTDKKVDAVHKRLGDHFCREIGAQPR